MNWAKLFHRVYIRISEMYNLQPISPSSLNLMELLREVAKVNPDGDIEPLYDVATGKIFEKRTKKYIVRMVNKFIAGIPEVLSTDENMASYASLKQLNLLIRAFDDGKKQISCFGLVYVYIMYTLLEGKSRAADGCASYVIILHDLVQGYYEDHPDDEVVAFFLGCFTPIIQAIRDKNLKLSGINLPSRPCKHPKETDD